MRWLVEQSNIGNNPTCEAGCPTEILSLRRVGCMSVMCFISSWRILKVINYIFMLTQTLFDSCEFAVQFNVHAPSYLPDCFCWKTVNVFRSTVEPKSIQKVCIFVLSLPMSYVCAWHISSHLCRGLMDDTLSELPNHTNTTYSMNTQWPPDNCWICMKD